MLRAQKMAKESEIQGNKKAALGGFVTGFAKINGSRRNYIWCGRRDPNLSPNCPHHKGKINQLTVNVLIDVLMDKCCPVKGAHYSHGNIEQRVAGAADSIHQVAN